MSQRGAPGTPAPPMCKTAVSCLYTLSLSGALPPRPRRSRTRARPEPRASLPPVVPPWPVPPPKMATAGRAPGPRQGGRAVGLWRLARAVGKRKKNEASISIHVLLLEHTPVSVIKLSTRGTYGTVPFPSARVVPALCLLAQPESG